ncbi:hypothetical protein MGYG_05558 [Nannizzia gypsea CBS 118893]|uniref:Uncharacterized protein n=1 Tax=Arthroderma gypseum (strain ATCC MYA-4604 / CBS 118893) TaxID=535722 RepID=E4UWL9_ARTGP|nr:hypothetical protein MGYG_05558 [Nannizzia gypsea CBS 118893]EFR02562.1 hypothetical protein MGYG_05558 [Nannizzia gypsea CBS 118893]
MPEPALPSMSSKLQTAPKRTQSTMNGSQALNGKAERWGTWSHPKRARKPIPSFSPQTPTPSQREPASSALRRVFEPPSTATPSSKQQPLKECHQHRQNLSASAPRPRTGRAPIPQFRTYSHTQSSAAKSKTAVAPEPDDEDALAIARIHAWLDKVDDEQIAAEVDAEKRTRARRACEALPAVQPAKKAEAEVGQTAPGVGEAEVEVEVEAQVEVPKTPKAPKTPTRNRRLALETDVPRVDSGWGTASPTSIGVAFMTPRTIPHIEEDDAVWEMLSPNVTPFRKGRGPKRTRRRSYYDEDIWAECAQLAAGSRSASPLKDKYAIHYRYSDTMIFRYLITSISFTPPALLLSFCSAYPLFGFRFSIISLYQHSVALCISSISLPILLGPFRLLVCVLASLFLFFYSVFYSLCIQT